MKKFKDLCQKEKISYVLTVAICLIATLCILLGVVGFALSVDNKLKASAETDLQSSYYLSGTYDGSFSNATGSAEYSFSIQFPLGRNVSNAGSYATYLSLRLFYVNSSNVLSNSYLHLNSDYYCSYYSALDNYITSRPMSSLSGLYVINSTFYKSVNNSYNYRPVVFAKNVGLLYDIANDDWSAWRYNNNSPYSLYKVPDYIEYGFVNFSDLISDYILVEDSIQYPRDNTLYYSVHWCWLRDSSGKSFNDIANEDNDDIVVDSFDIYLLYPYSDIGQYSTVVNSVFGGSLPSVSRVFVEATESYYNGYYVGLSQGKQIGFSEGYDAASSALTSAYDILLDSAYNSGEFYGYNSGVAQGLSDVTPFEVIRDGVDRVLSIQLFGGFKLSYLFYIGIGLFLLIFLLKVFLK